MFNAWLHLVALVLYLGSVLGLWIIVLPSLSAIPDHRLRFALIVRALKLYNPIQIGALGIVVITGAFQLTDLKALYRELFATEFGLTLGLKLLFSFLLIVLSVYQSLGIGHRIVKLHERGELGTPEELNPMIGRLKALVPPILILAALSLWLGVAMRR